MEKIIDNDDSSSSLSTELSTRTRQQTSSRMMKTTRRGRPYAKDTHDLFATLIVSLQLTTHRQYFKTYHNSFTTDEAAENLSALKFSQSNRAPDPKEPSRVVTTTTTTTFSMNRDMAKGICQHFMDARLIENAADMTSAIFKDKGVYVLTPKGLHILERFITKNGINGEHLLKVFSSQPICMKLLHLERRSHDDELLINRPVLEVIFRRFVGRQPNYAPGAAGAPTRDPSYSEEDFDRTMGVEMQDVQEKVKGQGVKLFKHTFPAIAALDWLCDFTTICGRDEAAEIAAHFVRLGLLFLVVDKARKEVSESTTVTVSGDDGSGRTTEGQFRCHYKALYGVTDRGRIVARWEGYRQSENSPTAKAAQRMSAEGFSSPQVNSAATPLDGEEARPVRPSRKEASPESGNSDVPNNQLGSSSLRRKASRVASSADRARHEYPGVHSGPPAIGVAGAGGGLGSVERSYLDGSPYNYKDSNTNRLKQVLEEPALRSLFREFLKRNFCEENLSFWLDVQDFKRRFHTTSSATAVKSPATNGSSEGSGLTRKFGRTVTGALGGGGGSSGPPGKAVDGAPLHGFTAMEKHQQDLIGMAFVIYNTYLAPASPCELNIEHNLRSELVHYMNKILADAAAPGGPGVVTTLLPDRGGPAEGVPRRSEGSMEERKSSSISATKPRAPLHASQLQTMVRLYERIQDHIFRLMATDSVPRFIKDPRFLNLVKSVEEYTEALESGRVDPRENAGPAIGKAVVEAMDLGGVASDSASSSSVSRSREAPLAKATPSGASSRYRKGGSNPEDRGSGDASERSSNSSPSLEQGVAR
ncbi:regulator of G protein signaling superfamily [Violaceomyces palustris]|uniref:Regulator of G protein signaling superfamily n=1 Tax=Violaceomyces palustris TaxID=1673888 RepID=A0ACD0NNZ2_9BASI|nr:regulator of G protein signaling superfamily [Violaceomyces palustris]